MTFSPANFQLNNSTENYSDQENLKDLKALLIEFLDQNKQLQQIVDDLYTDLAQSNEQLIDARHENIRLNEETIKKTETMNRLFKSLRDQLVTNKTIGLPNNSGTKKPNPETKNVVTPKPSFTVSDAKPSPIKI